MFEGLIGVFFIGRSTENFYNYKLLKGLFRYADRMSDDIFHLYA